MLAAKPQPTISAGLSGRIGVAGSEPLSSAAFLHSAVFESGDTQRQPQIYPNASCRARAYVLADEPDRGCSHSRAPNQTIAAGPSDGRTGLSRWS